MEEFSRKRYRNFEILQGVINFNSTLEGLEEVSRKYIRYKFQIDINITLQLNN